MCKWNHIIFVFFLSDLFHLAQCPPYPYMLLQIARLYSSFFFYFLFLTLLFLWLSNIQFSSAAHLCPTICDPMDCSMPGLPVHHQLPEFTHTHVHRVGDAIQPCHPLLSPSPPALNLSQHQGLFKWLSSSHQVAKVLEFQLPHQSFQWTPRTDLAHCV